RFGYHPQLPLLLQSVGVSKLLLLNLDESAVPSYRTTVVSWPALDGKQVEAFTRAPLPADSPQTFLHLAHHLHKTIMQDQAATPGERRRGAGAGAPQARHRLDAGRPGPLPRHPARRGGRNAGGPADEAGGAPGGRTGGTGGGPDGGGAGDGDRPGAAAGVAR